MKAVFDIETIEHASERHNDQISSNTIEEAVLRPVSIGCSSNITNDDKFFLRKSSDPDDAYDLVNQFLDYLFELVDVMHSELPEEIKNAYEVLQCEIQDKSKFSKAYCEKKTMLRTLQSYHIMSVYGFNSCKSIASFLTFINHTFQQSLTFHVFSHILQVTVRQIG